MNEIQEMKRQRLSISAISGLTGFNRRTVRKYLAEMAEPAPAYGPRHNRPGKLDDYKGYIESCAATSEETDVFPLPMPPENAITTLMEVTHHPQEPVG